jgi:hypothetical protein
VEKSEKIAINVEESLCLKGKKVPVMPIVLLMVALKPALFLNYSENRVKKDGLTKLPVPEKATKEIISTYLLGIAVMAEKVTNTFWLDKTLKESKTGQGAAKLFTAKNINRKYRLRFFIFASL